jgi:hypothetical protein
MAVTGGSGDGSTDSRFSRGPSLYTRTPVDFFWVLFIGAMIVAVLWYILNATSRRQK